MNGEPGDGVRLLLTVLCAGWLASFVFSFVAHGVAFDADDAARTAFLGWQAIAGLLAVAIFGVSRNWPQQASVRRIALVPLALSLLIVAGLTATYLWINIG